MLESERSLLASADELAQRAHHSVDRKRKAAVLTQHRLSVEQERAVHEVTSSGDLNALVAGSGKSTILLSRDHRRPRRLSLNPSPPPEN
jgi:hypothetical protein